MIRAILFLAFILPAAAADLCVSVAGSGSADGSDWDNTLAISFTPVRGNTYYLADGAYTTKTWGVAVSGTTLITIKKATESDHGPATGWVSTMGDGQAVFTAWSVTTPYWTFDGQTGGGPGAWMSGYGFALSNPSYSEGNHLLDSGGASGVTDITVRHTSMTFSNATDTGVYATAIYFASGIDRLTLSSNAIYQIPGDMCQFRGVNELVVEYCFFSENLSVAAKHGDVFENDGASDDHTIRYNWFKNCVGTYCISDQSGAGALSDVKVYGNLWSWNSDAPERGFNNGLVATDSGGTGISGLQFHQNTIYGFVETSLSRAGFYIPNGASANVVSNNIWYGHSTGQTLNLNFEGVTAHDYNAVRYAGTVTEANLQTLSADPFVNAAADNFRLSVDTDARAAVGSPYNVDILGVTFSSSRGAYQFQNPRIWTITTLNAVQVNAGGSQ